MTINPPTVEQVEYAASQPPLNHLYENTGSDKTPWNEDSIKDLAKNENRQTPIENESGQVNVRTEPVTKPQTADTFTEQPQDVDTKGEPEQPSFDFSKDSDE